MGQYPEDWLNSSTASDIGMPALSTGATVNSTTTYDEAWLIVGEAKATIDNVCAGFDVEPPVLVPDQEGHKLNFSHYENKLNSYWFHPDHLGSSSYVTNEAGVATQHAEYLPFGELLVDEHTSHYSQTKRSTSFNSPFKYNGKEFDEETGNYYYGARYYDPKWSIFISVDPLVDKTRDSYGYCYRNPIIYTDPTGMESDDRLQ